MSWIPSFEIGIWNAWLFMILYPLQWLAVVVIPKHIAERTSHAPEILQNRQDRIMSFLTQGFWIGATLYSIFLPLQVGTIWLWVGLALFIAGLVLLVWATVSVASTPKDTPFTAGVYRYSRHPMYLSMFCVYLGVSVAAASWLFFLITIITFFLQRYQMVKEEKFCSRKFGLAYQYYIGTTPRFIGIPKSVSKGKA
jgi:protein-S-isoprenylcysteine O-methyltransferase Ste14